jgi:hypothetical protein
VIQDKLTRVLVFVRVDQKAQVLHVTVIKDFGTCEPIPVQGSYVLYHPTLTEQYTQEHEEDQDD